jgi:hypothetical protein
MGITDYQPAWATIAGYDYAFWPEPGGAYYRTSVPEIDVRCMVQYPLAEETPTKPWLLYEWWNLECNEWDSIEDIENTAVVLAQLDPIPGFKPNHVCSALPIQVLRVPDLLKLTPQSHKIGFWKDPYGRLLEGALALRTRVHYYSFGPYRVCNVNFEGDAGMWAIFHEAESDVSALLVCDWCRSHRLFYAGHGRLTSEEADHLREFISGG